MTWHQIWSRYTENNTGTLRAPGKPQYDQFDFALRRSRLLLLAQLNPRFLIYTHIGINNQTAVSGGVSPSYRWQKAAAVRARSRSGIQGEQVPESGRGHALPEWPFTDDAVQHDQLSDHGCAATNWPTIEAIDQFVRGIGVYAKGPSEQVDYAFSVNESFLTNQA